MNQNQNPYLIIAGESAMYGLFYVLCKHGVVVARQTEFRKREDLEANVRAMREEYNNCEVEWRI